VSGKRPIKGIHRSCFLLDPSGNKRYSKTV
jgi:hypothetical protein